MAHLIHAWHGWFLALFLFCAALVFSNAAHFIFFRVLKRKESVRFGSFLGLKKYLQRPARVIFIATCTLLVLPWIPLSGGIRDIMRQALQMILVLGLGWFAVGLVYVLENALVRHYDISSADNIRARRIRTQMTMFRRVLIGFIAIIDAGALLWTFHDPRIWHYGTGLIASAGLASLLLATAAKSTASNFLAGFQIALTEPIRLDDVVIVEGEWGRIEEIRTTYVVVKIWDLRRLIVPLTYFIDKPFQNWTRESADLLGTSFLYVDYSVPVEPLRQRLKQIVEESPLWDKVAWGLQVTNLSERTMELRCLVSARNSSDQFDLRCLVREKMMTYIQENYPETLPRARFSAIPDSKGGSQEGEPLSSPGSQSAVSRQELPVAQQPLPPPREPVTQPPGRDGKAAN